MGITILNLVKRDWIVRVDKGLLKQGPVRGSQALDPFCVLSMFYSEGAAKGPLSHLDLLFAEALGHGDPRHLLARLEQTSSCHCELGQ